MNRLCTGKEDVGGDHCDQTGRGKGEKRVGGGGRKGGRRSPLSATCYPGDLFIGYSFLHLSRRL